MHSVGAQRPRSALRIARDYSEDREQHDELVIAVYVIHLDAIRSWTMFRLQAKQAMRMTIWLYALVACENVGVHTIKAVAAALREMWKFPLQPRFSFQSYYDCTRFRSPTYSCLSCHNFLRMIRASRHPTNEAPPRYSITGRFHSHWNCPSCPSAV